MIDLGVLAVLLLIGLEWGSFCNVCIHRWPRGGSVRFPARSHCPWCDHLITWRENIPVLSFLIQRGRCRWCRGSISWRYPVVELALPLIWLPVLLLWRDWSGGLDLVALASILLLLLLLLVAAVVDAEWKIIPDQCSIGILFAGLAFAVINPLVDRSFLSAVIGVTAGYGVLWAVAAFGRFAFGKEAMGGGDVKLMAGIGAYLGWQGVVGTLIGASILGSIVAGGAILAGRIRRQAYIPFGPFLVLAAYAVLLFRLWDRVGGLG